MNDANVPDERSEGQPERQVVGETEAEPELLFGRALGGDEDALASLLLRFNSYLVLLGRMYVRRRLQAKIDPADLAQETCLEALSSFAAFRGSTLAEFTAWLKKLLASRGLQAVRRYHTQARDVGLELPLYHDWEESSAALDRFALATGATPSRHLAATESAWLLAQALERLSPLEQEVIIQHGLEGVPMATVAVRVQKSVDSVWKVWARGLVKLRRLLAVDER